MVQKYISQTKAYEIIATALIRHDSNFNFEENLDVIFCKEIANLLKNTKYGYVSVIFRIVNETASFKEYFSKKHKHLKSIIIINKSVNIHLLRYCLQENNVELKNICKNWRNEFSIYGKLCADFRIKNSLENRKRIYNSWRILKETSSTDDNNDVNPRFPIHFATNKNEGSIPNSSNEEGQNCLRYQINETETRISVLDSTVRTENDKISVVEKKLEKTDSSVMNIAKNDSKKTNAHILPISPYEEAPNCISYQTLTINERETRPLLISPMKNYEISEVRTEFDEIYPIDLTMKKKQYSYPISPKEEAPKCISQTSTTNGSETRFHSMNSIKENYTGKNIKMVDPFVPFQVETPVLNIKDVVEYSDKKYKKITPEKRDVSNGLLDLSSPGPEACILPLGSKNTSQLNKKVDYSNCTVFEGCFLIPDNIWEKIFSNGKLNVKYYPEFIRNRIKKFVNNVCIIVFKYVKYAKKNERITIFAVCKYNKYTCKKFKIEIKHKRVDVYSSSTDYNHTHFGTSQVRGVERLKVGNKILNEKPSNYKKRIILDANQQILNAGKNLQGIKSDCVVRKIKSEATSHLDRDKNDIIDIILMQKDHSDYIREVSFPFNVKLYSYEQLSVLKMQSKNNVLPIIHLDATGGVVRSLTKDMRKLLFYAAVIRIKNSNRIYPIFSMISSIHDSNCIFKLLHDFRFFCESYNYWPAFSGVVTDFSFANLHAICKSFNRCTLLEYLQICYDINIKQKTENKSLIRVYLCCAHFMKMVSKDVEIIAANDQQKPYFKDLIALAISINKIEIFDSFVKHVYVLLKSKNKSIRTDYAQHWIQNVLTRKSSDNDEIDDLKHCEFREKLSDDDSKVKGLLKSSPYYKRFNKIVESVQLGGQGNKENSYCNDGFFDLIILKYLPLCCLWSALMMADQGPVSNSLVENYFGQLKNIRLNFRRNLKCSQFIRKLREDVLAMSVECNLGIRNTRLTKGDPTDEQFSQEHWAKKGNRKTGTHFDAKYLRNTNIETSNRDIIFPEDDDELPLCAYCGHGIINEITDWVKCDKCLRWIHQTCDSGEKSNTIYEGVFHCKLCTITPPKTVPSKFNNVRSKCMSFLDSLNLTEIELKKLEQITRDQRKSDIWHKERKFRVTSSYFGRICKVRDSSSFVNIVKSITKPKQIRCPAIAHGIQYEDQARTSYSELTNNSCQMSGLTIHKKYPFLAASPDGLVNEDGVIEIKCPFKARYSDPSKYKFDFFDKTNSKINVNHDYHYQIQGILEITDRNWCDLVIFTFKGLRIVRIFRSHTFFDVMLKKLEYFYKFYMLPSIVYPSAKLSERERKWTSKDIHFLENGLISDIYYYKELENKRGYVVSVNPDVTFTLSEILIDDYLTLDDGKWLSSFILEHCMFLMNSADEKYQLISVAKSSIIFGDEPITEKFVNTININKNEIVLPVVRHNHFILVILNIDTKKITLLDPIGNEESIKLFYMGKMIDFLRLKGIDTNEVDTVVLDHAIQADGFNCGIFLIYFFSKLVKNQPLTMEFDASKFRKNLKFLLLKHSWDMKFKCLYCSMTVNIEDDTFRCEICQRYFHDKCLTTLNELKNGITSEHKKINGICDLCFLN